MKKSLTIFTLLALLISPLSAGELEDALRAYENEDYATAHEKLLPIAEEGNAEAQYFLGRMYYHGYGVEENKEEAAKWYKLSFEYYSTPTKEGSMPDGFYHYLTFLSYYLGDLYEHGIGVEKDQGKAMRLYDYAAYNGHPEAQYKLGNAYYHGRGVGKNLKKALKWYKRAANQGHLGAQWLLGIMYSMGKEVKIDYKEAVKWYTLAAEQGNDSAIQVLIDIYSEGGYGIEKNYKEVVKWYTILVEQGHYYSKQNLANIYYEGGYGIEKDEQEADKWYKLAFKKALPSAKKDDNYAQHLVGLMYEFGKGVEKNYTRAFKWYSRSAKKGSGDSQYRLGVMYSKGYGVKKDMVSALMWGIISTEYSLFYPRLLPIHDLKEREAFRDSLLSEMTPKQIEQAEQLAKTCKESNYTEC